MNQFLQAVVVSVAIGIPAATEPTMAVPAGTRVQVKLLKLLTSQNSQPGEAVQFEVAQDVVIQGVVVISRGTPAEGSVTDAKAYRSYKRFWTLHHSFPGQLGFTISRTRSVAGDDIRLWGPLLHVNQPPHGPMFSWHHEGETFDAVVLPHS